MSVTITIRRKELLALRACESGLALFDAIASHQDRQDRVRFKWTPLADAYLSLSGHAGWLRDHRLIPAADLGGANLYGADLRGADLGGANLRGADLYGADLRGARRPDNAPKGWRSVNWYLEQEAS